LLSSDPTNAHPPQRSITPKNTARRIIYFLLPSFFFSRKNAIIAATIANGNAHIMLKQREPIALPNEYVAMSHEVIYKVF